VGIGETSVPHPKTAAKVPLESIRSHSRSPPISPLINLELTVQDLKWLAAFQQQQATCPRATASQCIDEINEHNASLYVGSASAMQVASLRHDAASWATATMTFEVCIPPVKD